MIGKVVGILGIVTSFIEHIITIINSPNLNALERAALAIVAGIGMLYAAVVVIYASGEILAILFLAIAITLITELIFRLLLYLFESAFYRPWRRYMFAYSKLEEYKHEAFSKRI